MTPERKKIVERLREEGRQAALAGKPVQANPHKFENAFQWWSGYRMALIEKEAEERESQQEARAKASKLAQRIENECYKGTTANEDWDSEFDAERAARMIFEEYVKEEL